MLMQQELYCCYYLFQKLIKVSVLDLIFFIILNSTKLAMLHVNGHSSSSSSSKYSTRKCNATQEVQSSTDHSPRLSFQFYYSSAELLTEIITLEDEITHLEHYLLSLYREASKQRFYALSEKHETDLPNKIQAESTNIIEQSHSSLESSFHKDTPVHHNCIFPACDSTNSEDWNRATLLKPSTERDRVVVEHGHRSLADYLVASRIDNNLNRPDKLSEDIVRCISSIYIKLAHPTRSHRVNSDSSISAFSSSGAFSPSSDSWISEEARGHQIAYAGMFEVLKLSLDDDSFNYAVRVLQNFRLLINNLEKVDTMKMAHEEKVAFWINIHNALVMHAHIAYGTSNHVKSASILKAAYNVSGQCITADIIQSSILGIRSHYSAPWLDTLLSPGKKFKPARTRHKLAIDHVEPLVHFALSSGVHSDPAVRVYSASRIREDLKVAEQEFIEASVYINHKETKICLPKILDYFAKDMSLTLPALLEIVHACLSESQQKTILRCMRGRPDRFITWLPQSSTFRYVIHKQVAN